MPNNQLMEQIRRLNEQERLEHEQKRIKALNKIKELRERQKREQDVRDAIPQ